MSGFFIEKLKKLKELGKKPGKKREIEKEIKELNKEKARLKAEEKELKDMGREPEEIQEQIREIDKQIKEKYDELASLEYEEAMKELGEEAKEKKITLTRLKAEVKKHKKEKEKLQQKLENIEEEKEQLKQEKRELAKKINEMQEELKDREMQLKQKQEIIEEEQEGKKEDEGGTEKESKPTQEQLERLQTKIDLLEGVLEKHREHIEEKEKKTIREMKGMIQPNNINLREYLSGIEEEAEDEIEASEQAYKKIMEEIKACKAPPVEHWMTIKSMLDRKITDCKDRAILLCSAFRHFGAQAHVITATLENNERIPLVRIKINEKHLLINPKKQHPFRKYYGTMEELEQQFQYQGEGIRKFNYMYNDREYRTFEE